MQRGYLSLPLRIPHDEVTGHAAVEPCSNLALELLEGPRPLHVVRPSEPLGDPDDPGVDVDLTPIHTMASTRRYRMVQIVSRLAE